MFKTGVIGAGTISVKHIESYSANPFCELNAIADINIEQAQKRAKAYNIPNVYSDYHDILNDDTIDAVSIVTPTFTHKQIVLEALAKGKHVLGEKPPALNAKDAAECRDAAKKYGKCLMYGLVRHFNSYMKYTKEYIDAGKMGKIISGEAFRLSGCSGIGGWFIDKSKSGGGPLMDSAIHQLDSLLYLMGYPKPKAVLGFTTDMNNDLPQKMNGAKTPWSWVSADKNKYERTVESVASGYILFENGSYIFIKTSAILNTVSTGTYIELCGEKAGVKMESWSPGKEIQLLECTDDYYLREVKPLIDKNDAFQEEINHFIDCCVNGTECICNADDGVKLMEVIDAIYKSGETGEPVLF
ncbi:MAG: Gfo/Idh/MocA family oxidoreductase [Clostridia bacterium]|nr:Gfo/Idh/MocA family oxidoreductase [Clostridia bacterium]